MSELAYEFALNQNFKALEILFTRHGDQVLSFRLDLIQTIPPTSDPSNECVLIV